MSTRLTRARSLLSVVALTGAMSAVALPAQSVTVRTETTLGGFSITTNAAPFKVLIDDPGNPLPRPEDSAIIEADPAYSQADLATGPAARAIGSSLWPGNLLGEGIPTATEGAAPQYPIKAEARYPDKPFTEEDKTGGTFMKASAMGLDVTGSARSGPMSGLGGNLEIGSANSSATATVDKAAVATGRSVSQVSDVSLLAGIIKVGSVSTVVETRSDGKDLLTSGTTVVSGLTVGPFTYVVDEKGARVVSGPVPAPGSGPLPPGAFDPAKMAGITIDGLVQTSSKKDGTAVREARGLRITVDTTVLRRTLDPLVPAPVTSALFTVFSMAPKEVRGFLFYSLSATPKITFILGAGQSSAAAVLPISFDFPPLPTDGGFVGVEPPPAFSPPATGGLGSAGTPGLGAPTVETGLPDTGAPPAVAPPGSTAPVLAGSSQPNNPFKGVSALLLLAAALAAALGGWGLLSLRGFAFAGGLLGSGCALGAPSDLPDLRSVTS